MNAIIVGGGKVGFYLAKTLLEQDYTITVIEQGKEQCRFCANNLDAQVIQGDGTMVETLRGASTENADALIAVMGRDENNLVSCQIAKRLFGVRKTIAKVNNPKNAETLKLLGVDIVISATDNIIRSLEHEVDFSLIKELIPLNEGDASLVEITLPEDYSLNGTALMDLKLPPECNIVSISRGGYTIIPRGKTRLRGGDVMLIVVLGSEIKELKRALKIKE